MRCPIKKINATKKNRNEKGNRPSILVEKPYSNGLAASRLKLNFFLKNLINPNKTIDNIILKII